MNILVFSWRDPKHPLAGGAEQVDHEHHKGWIAAGHKVALFSSMFSGASKNDLIDRVKIIRKGNQYTAFISAFFWYLFSDHEEYDLVVDEFHGWPFFTPLYIRRPKIAVIQEITKEVWFKYPLPYKLNLIFGPIGYLLEPIFFLPYRNVQFMIGSNSAKEELVIIGIDRENIAVVPHGVILDIPKKLLKKEKTKTVIFLGALAKDKGIEDAIKTFAILNSEDKYQFWVVGKSDREYLKFLKRMAYDLKVDIRFFGFVNQNEKFNLLSKAHIMINPSIREGFGLVNIEANACGVPVIAYNSPGLTDSVKDRVSGIIIENNSPEDLAKNVNRVFDNKILYEKLVKGAIHWSKKFDWKISKKVSLALVEEIGLE